MVRNYYQIALQNENLFMLQVAQIFRVSCTLKFSLFQSDWDRFLSILHLSDAENGKSASKCLLKFSLCALRLAQEHDYDINSRRRREKLNQNKLYLQYQFNKLHVAQRDSKELRSQNLNVCTNTHSHIWYTRKTPEKILLLRFSINRQTPRTIRAPATTSAGGHSTATMVHLLSVAFSIFRSKQLFDCQRWTWHCLHASLRFLAFSSLLAIPFNCLSNCKPKGDLLITRNWKKHFD